MTTNIDRAAELLWIPEPHLSVSECDDQARELAQVLAAAGLLMPDLPEPDDLLDAVSLDGTIGVMAIWGHNVDVEAMQNPRLRGQGSVTVFGRQVRNPRELAHQILAAADYAERNQE
jgi:hypothetical protein